MSEVAIIWGFSGVAFLIFLAFVYAFFSTRRREADLRQWQGAISAQIEAIRASGESRAGQLELLRSLSEARAGQTERALGEIKASSAESALALSDTLIDRFYLLNSSLSKSQQNTQQLLQDSLKNIDDGFKAVREKVASIEHLGDLRDSIDEFSRIFSSQKLRGNFGEFELERVLSVGFGAASNLYELQHRLDNGRIADCVLKLAHDEIVCIDAKFPLENYRRMVDADDEATLKSATKEFEKDVKKHILDISSRYIMPPQTLEYAVMFVPAQAVFLRISESAGLLEYALERGVFIASASTLMPLIYSLKLLVRDVSLAKHANEVKAEISKLAQDFSEYESARVSLAKALKKAINDLSVLDARSQVLLTRFRAIEGGNERD
ncbi:DNA recombination protein RmuC [Campylobacter sp. 19-13652]|uniref:DNA recombination protein RmuC n=1 Tax=Campylobacter sp. 19-13652 TaxID=2840180 RepID=UPI001C76AB66|nr:DNA recombination protein RmuC [Campylobacter sp. 19-13652]BCX79575.1 hypothetical protein LBC_10370 [Campylobacter sp. 19-13652]